MCKPQNNNAYSGNFVAGVHLPWAFAASNNICNSLATWYDANNPGTMAWGTSTGYWVGFLTLAATTETYCFQTTVN
jgi:hypothetical protein